MQSEQIPKIFYWYDDYDPGNFAGMVQRMQQSNKASHRMAADQAATVVAHLQQGREHRAYKGWANCRICGAKLGTRDMTNVLCVWPEGAEHYISAHGVWTPEHTWLAAVLMGRVDPRTRPPPQMTKTGQDSGTWRSRIPALVKADAEESAENVEVPDKPRRPKTAAEKMGFKMVKAMAKVWEAGEFDEMFVYMYSLMPLEMREDVIGVAMKVADPSWLPQVEVPVPVNADGDHLVDMSTHRPMTEAEMWEVAAERAIQDGDF